MKEVLVKYLELNNSTINDDVVMTRDIAMINELDKIFGFSPLFASGFREILYIQGVNKIRIIFDERARITKYVDGFTNTTWEKKFDKNGNCIFYKDSNGYWIREFDDDGNIIKFEKYK